MYKILSLDGGGSWALLQLLTLQDKYPGRTGHEILREFDMVIANSGGAIVLAALAEDWSIEKAISLFDDEENRNMIFSKNGFRDRYFPVDYLRLFKSFGPKYSVVKKREAFEKLFKKVNKRQMVDLPKFIGKPSLKLVVCTYDALNNRAKFFKSYGEKEERFDSVRLTQAINGSSNAPIQYFDFPTRFQAKGSEVWYSLWDGALGGFNNPVVAGVIEAQKLGHTVDQIKLVSLGNGNKLMSVEEKTVFYNLADQSTRKRRKKLAFWNWGTQAKFFARTVLNQAKTILYEPPDWANYVALMFLLKGAKNDIGDRFVRLSPVVHFDKNTEPSVIPLLKTLYKLDMDLTKDSDIQLIKDCFTNWKAGKIKNQPIEYEVTRANELIYHTGQETYAEGMKLW